MNTITTTEQTSLNIHDSAIEQQSLNIHDSIGNFSKNNSELLDDTELELERIMFEEFAHGLPSDIPMCDL
jgi:hypothetical protein